MTPPRPIRFGEAYFCQFEDFICDEMTVGGTSYCQPHLDTMRTRAELSVATPEEAALPDPVEMQVWDDDDATGVAA